MAARLFSEKSLIASSLCCLLLLGCESSEWNSPYRRADQNAPIIYSWFSERPKELDPVDPRYFFYVTREAANKRSERRKVSRIIRPREKNDIFILRSVKGDLTRPDGFILELLDSNRSIEVDVGEEYTEVAGYEADLMYPPENDKKFNDRRKGDTISIDKRNYKIVFVSASDVVLADEKTTKHTKITKDTL